MAHDTTPMTIWDPQGETSATVPAHQFETVWRPRGWHSEDPQVDKPTERDLKAVWEVYAVKQGLDPDGKTKAEIIAAVNDHQDSDGQTVDGDDDNDAREGVEEDS